MMTSSDPPSSPGLFTLSLAVPDERDMTQVRDGIQSLQERLRFPFTSLPLAVRHLLAIMRYHSNDAVEAEAEFNAVLEQDPDNWNSLHSLAYLYRRSGREEQALILERRLEAAMEHPLPLAHAQCLAEQAYVISFTRFERVDVENCLLSNSWLQRSKELATQDRERVLQEDDNEQQRTPNEIERILNRAKRSVAEWRLCMLWNLKKAFLNTYDPNEKHAMLLNALDVIWDSQQTSEGSVSDLMHSLLGFFLGKSAYLRVDDERKAKTENVIRERGWVELSQDPSLCFERALSNEGLDSFVRFQVIKLYSEFLGRERTGVSTLQRLTGWAEEAKREKDFTTVGNLLQTKAIFAMVWYHTHKRNMLVEESLKLLNQSRTDLLSALELRPYSQRILYQLSCCYVHFASVYRHKREPRLQHEHAEIALDYIAKLSPTSDPQKERQYHQRRQDAYNLLGWEGRDPLTWQKRWLQVETPQRLTYVLKLVLPKLAAQDRREDRGFAAPATSAAFWIDHACAKLGHILNEDSFEILVNLAHTRPQFAKKVCACAEDMANNGELNPRDGSWLEELQGLTGLQPGHVDSRVQEALELDRSEFSPPDDLPPRNWKGVAWDVGVVCAPEDVTWFRRGAWRYLVGELGMKVQLLPPEGDMESLSRDCHKLLVVVSASFWTWVETSGHVAWLRGRGWRQGAGLLRGDAPPPPHLQGALAVLTRSLTSGDWAALLQALL